MAISHQDHKEMRLSSLEPQFPVARPTYMGISFFLLYLLWRMTPRIHADQASAIPPGYSFSFNDVLPSPQTHLS